MIETIISFGNSKEGSNRVNKGASLLEFPASYTAIDIETTGLDPRYNEIIELAAIRYDCGKEIARFQSLVNPGVDIDDFIEELTGITNDMLTDAPNLETVLPEFRSFIKDEILVGHNIHFDINFIYDCSETIGLSPLSNDFVDTLRLGRRIFPELQNHKLNTLCERCSISNGSAHRALSDCERAHGCYSYMRNYAEENAVSLKLKRPSFNVLARNLHPETHEFNHDGPIYGKKFAFTGKLELFTRKEAMQQVLNAGGLCSDGVTSETNFLVLGNNDYCRAIKEGKSSKQKKAEKLQLQGYDILTISESVFCDMLHESQRQL